LKILSLNFFVFGVHLSFATVFLLFSTFFLLFRRFIFRGHKKMKIKKSNERRKKPAFIRLFATGIAHLSITVSVIILEQMESSEIDPNLLKDNLAVLKKDYDFIIIDTPPALGNLLQLSLVASDYVIVPCEPRPFALNRIDSFYETIKATNKKLKVLGLLLVKYNDRATLNKQIRIALETKARLMNTQTFKTYIRDGIAVGESQTVQQPLIEYAPKSKPSIDYMDFTEEVLQRLEVKKK